MAQRRCHRSRTKLSVEFESVFSLAFCFHNIIAWCQSEVTVTKLQFHHIRVMGDSNNDGNAKYFYES